MTMDEMFKEAIRQSPSLGVMFAIVVTFLRFLKDMMASHAKRTDEFIIAVREMKEEDRVSRDRNSDALTNLGTEITRLSAVADSHRQGGSQVAAVFSGNPPR